MEQKLTLSNLACYLPYGLKFRFIVKDGTIDPVSREIISVGLDHVRCGENYIAKYHFHEIKPLLLPLSELTKEQAKSFGYVDLDDFITGIEKGFIPYVVWIQLVEKHYDVFNLLESGLALDKSIYKLTE